MYEENVTNLMLCAWLRMCVRRVFLVIACVAWRVQVSTFVPDKLSLCMRVCTCVLCKIVAVMRSVVALVVVCDGATLTVHVQRRGKCDSG